MSTLLNIPVDYQVLIYLLVDLYLITHKYHHLMEPHLEREGERERGEGGGGREERVCVCVCVCV